MTFFPLEGGGLTALSQIPFTSFEGPSCGGEREGKGEERRWKVKEGKGRKGRKKNIPPLEINFSSYGLCWVLCAARELHQPGSYSLHCWSSIIALFGSEPMQFYSGGREICFVDVAWRVFVTTRLPVIRQIVGDSRRRVAYNCSKRRNTNDCLHLHLQGTDTMTNWS